MDAERLRLARDLELFELRRGEYTAAAAALCSITGEPLTNATYERGQRELTRLARLEEQSEKATALSAALAESELLAARQASAMPNSKA